jgi:transcriptional regulator of acetoin/glycerol metabolism
VGDHLSASDVRFDTDRSSTRELAAQAASTDEASLRTLEEVEREHIARALASEQGRVAEAARKLGIPRSTLYQKLKTYGIALPTRTRVPGAPPSSSGNE